MNGKDSQRLKYSTVTGIDLNFTLYLLHGLRSSAQCSDTEKCQKLQWRWQNTHSLCSWSLIHQCCTVSVQCFHWILRCNSAQYTVHALAQWQVSKVGPRAMKVAPKREGCLFSQLFTAQKFFLQTLPAMAPPALAMSLLLKTIRKNTSQCLQLRNTLEQVAKRDSFRPLTLTQN